MICFRSTRFRARPRRPFRPSATPSACERVVVVVVVSRARLQITHRFVVGIARRRDRRTTRSRPISLSCARRARDAREVSRSIVGWDRSTRRRGRASRSRRSNSTRANRVVDEARRTSSTRRARARIRRGSSKPRRASVAPRGARARQRRASCGAAIGARSLDRRRATARGDRVASVCAARRMARASGEAIDATRRRA